MSLESEFLRDIRAHPQDDAVRLVYADWLDEQDQADRAEFIRAQVRLAGMKPWDQGYTELDVRCRELARCHPDWLGWLDPFVEKGTFFFGRDPFPFHRGFPTRVTMRPEALVEHHHQLFETAPIQGITLDLGSIHGPPVLRTGYPTLPGLPCLSEVRFRCLEGPTAVREAIRCLRRLSPLESYALVGCRLREKDAQTLLQTAPMLGVRSLGIWGTALTDPIEQQLTESHFPNLRRLERVGFTRDLGWLKAGWVGQLEELTIDDTGPNLDPGETSLLSEIVPELNLTALVLGSWALDQAGARRLGEALGRTRLQALTLSHTRVPDLIWSVLSSDKLADLGALFVTWAIFDGKFIQDLSSRLAGSELRVCGLDHVTPGGAMALATGGQLPELASLRLGLICNSPADPLPEALRSVLDSDQLPGLVSLALVDLQPAPGGRPPDRGDLGDRILKALAGCAGVARLQELRLDLRNLTRVGTTALAESPHLERLRLLDVSVKETSEAADILRSRFGDRVGFFPGGRTY